jgi:hypothetical protein
MRAPLLWPTGARKTATVPVVIRATTVDVDLAALDRGVLAFVPVDSTAWMGDRAEDFAAVPEIQETFWRQGVRATKVFRNRGISPPCPGCEGRVSLPIQQADRLGGTHESLSQCFPICLTHPRRAER